MSETITSTVTIEALPGARDLSKVQYLDAPIDIKRAAPGTAAGLGLRAEDDDKVYEVAISSEKEIERWFGIEVLEHSKDAVDLSRLARGGAVLIDHRGDQVGVVLRPRIDDDKVLRGFLKFSASTRGQEIERDVADGIRRFISVGYMIHQEKREDRETGKDEKGNPIFTPVYRVVRWEPAEVSIVSVPADLSVGVGRSAAGPPVAGVTEARAPATAAAMEVRAMTEAEKKPDAVSAAGAVAVIEDARSETQKGRDSQQAEIVEMCDQHGQGGRAPEFIRQGLNRDQVAYELMKLRASPKPGQGNMVPVDVMARLRASDRRRFSYARALRIGMGRAEEERGEHGGIKFDGLEAEVHRELEKTFGPAAHGGVLVPHDLRTYDEQLYALEKRALDSKTVTKGAEGVFDVPGEFIELLRNRSVVIQSGARVLSGLTAPVGFPKQAAAGSAIWVGENPGADVTDADLTLGLVTLQPKSLQSSTAYSRQLLVQASVDVESLVRNDQALIHGIALDKAGIHGQSAAGQPTGIYLTPGVNAQAHGGAITYANLVAQAAEVAKDNADLGSLAWITSPAVAGKLKTTPEHATLGIAGWVWQGTFRDGTIAGYPARGTNQVAAGTMLGTVETGGTEYGIVFGNFNDMIIGLFGALEIVVDPYTKKKRGLIEVTSFQMADIILRHPESFCVSTGATLA